MQEKILHQYNSSALISNNIILGDTLKFTHLCLENIFFNGKFENFTKIVLTGIFSIAKRDLNNAELGKLLKTTIESRNYLLNSFVLIKKFQNFGLEMRMVKNSIGDKVKTLCLDIENNLQEVETFVLRYNSLSASVKVLSESHEKASKMIIRIENNKRNVKDHDVFCKNCRKRYKESQNFNWSCKRHSGLWSGTNYWCCGNRQKDSQGCIISFHQSENSEKSESNVKPELNCPTCKKKGHNFSQCDRDPNCQSSLVLKNPRSEIERIEKLKRRREKKKSNIKNAKYEENLQKYEFMEIDNIKALLSDRYLKEQQIREEWGRTPELQGINTDYCIFPQINTPKSQFSQVKSPQSFAD